MFSSSESINQINTSSSARKAIKDFFLNPLPSHHYESIYGVNLWWNFLVPDIFNFRTTQISVSSQLAIPDWRLETLQHLVNFLTFSTPVSINFKNKFSNFRVPPLIDSKKLIRNVDKKLVLCYSVSGNNFFNTLKMIASNNKNYNFKFFTKDEFDNNIPNIELYEPDKFWFKKYQSSCCAVLCTSGNELILECVYNNIPVATMSCSSLQFEQNYNEDMYINKLGYALKMTDNLKIENLVNFDISEKSLELSDNICKRDETIFKLCDLNTK